MPDQYLQDGWRLATRVARGASYGALVVAGAFGLMFQPYTISHVLGAPLTLWWSSLVFVGAAIALTGIIINNYRLEWLALWPVIGGSIIYASTVWFLTLTEEPGRSTQAGFISGLTFLLVVRAFELAAHAAKLRAEHEQTGPVIIAKLRDHGDDHG